MSKIDFGCKIISFLYLKQKVVCRTSDFVGSLSDFLVELAATPLLTEVCFPARSYFHRASLCLLQTIKTLTVQNSRVRYARQAIFHSRARSLEKNAVSEHPIFARQDVQQYPDRLNMVPSANSQFPISNSLNETIQAPPLLRPCHYIINRTLTAVV